MGGARVKPLLSIFWAGSVFIGSDSEGSSRTLLEKEEHRRALGTLIYGPSATEIEFDDRLLAHLRIVIITKVRNQEPFSMSWSVDLKRGSGRETLWIHPSIPLRFRFADPRPHPVNRAWLQQLLTAAHTGDLILTPEPAPDAPA
jgi:hypothetical protein